jgi:hypothetical protein
MDTKTQSTRMLALVALYDMQTTFFKNVIDGFNDKDAHNRLGTKANHVAWLTGSLVEQRFGITKDSGITIQQKAHELFKDGKGIQDDITYPPLADFKKDWETISPLTRMALVEVTDEKLDNQIEMGGMKMTFFDLVAFTIYREANCIGQIALWRRLLGYAAMKYE